MRAYEASDLRAEATAARRLAGTARRRASFNELHPEVPALAVG